MKNPKNPCNGCIYEHEPCGGCGEADRYLALKQCCKQTLLTALSYEHLFPSLFPNGELEAAIRNEYSQEFIAECLAEIANESHIKS